MSPYDPVNTTIEDLVNESMKTNDTAELLKIQNVLLAKILYKLGDLKTTPQWGPKL